MRGGGTAYLQDVGGDARVGEVERGGGQRDRVTAGEKHGAMLGAEGVH